MRRLLMDNGSLCDILFLKAFMKMGIKPSNLKPCSGYLMKFTRHEVPVIGMITLPMTLGERPKATTAMVDFLVMDLPSAYNGIIGKSSQALLGVIPSV